MTFRESPTDRLEQAFVSLLAFRLGSRISTGARRQRGGEPEPDEESKRLRSNSQVTFGLRYWEKFLGRPGFVMAQSICL